MPPKAPRVSECEAGGLLRVKRTDLVKMVRALSAEKELERIVKARKTKDFNRKPTRAELCAAINARRKNMSRRRYLLLLGPALVAAVLGVAVWKREVLGLGKIQEFLGEKAKEFMQSSPQPVIAGIPAFEPTTRDGAYLLQHPPQLDDAKRTREIMRQVAAAEKNRMRALQEEARYQSKLVKLKAQQDAMMNATQARAHAEQINATKQAIRAQQMQSRAYATQIAETRAKTRQEEKAAMLTESAYYQLKTYPVSAPYRRGTIPSPPTPYRPMLPAKTTTKQPYDLAPPLYAKSPTMPKFPTVPQTYFPHVPQSVPVSAASVPTTSPYVMRRALSDTKSTLYQQPPYVVGYEKQPLTSGYSKSPYVAAGPYQRVQFRQVAPSQSDIARARANLKKAEARGQYKADNYQAIPIVVPNQEMLRHREGGVKIR